MRYDSLYHRLVANTDEPPNEQACWTWKRQRDRWGYGRLNVYVPGLRTKVKLMAHVALWVWSQTAPASVDEFYLFYLEVSASGLELDHLCVNPACLNIDHVEVVTGSENCLRRSQQML